MENMHIALLLLFYAVLYTICHVYVSVAIYIISISFLMLFHAYPYIYHVCTINIHDITICDVMKVMHIALLLLFYAVSYTICHVYVPDASHLVSIFFLMHFNTYPYIYHVCHVIIHDIDIYDVMKIVHVSPLLLFMRFCIPYVMYMCLLPFISYPSPFSCYLTHIHIYIMFVLSIFMILIYGME